MKKIKPIRTSADYEEALATTDKFFDAHSGTSDADFIEVLAVLIEDYERKNFPISLPDPIEAILYHLDSRNLDRKHLENFIGSRGRVSEILNRKRPLSMAMIRNLHEGLGIPLEILLQKYMDEPGMLPSEESRVKVIPVLLRPEKAWSIPNKLIGSNFPDIRKSHKVYSNVSNTPLTRTTFTH